jgi:DNA replication protein DnaC
MSPRDGQPESLGAVLTGLVRGAVIDPELDDATEPGDVCESCRGCGFCRADVEPGHPDFGRLFPCPACGPKRHADHIAGLMERLWRNDGDDWEHYRDVSLDSYPWSSQTQPVRPTLERWLRDDPKWLMLWGPYRRGKTGLAVSLIRELVSRGQPALLVTVPRLLDRIRSTYAPGSDDSESDVLETLIGAPVLLMDDMGVEKVSEHVLEKLYTIVNGRLLGHRRTIITTNLDPEAALERLGERVLWRVLEMCDEYVVKIDGPNLSARKRP